MGVQAVRLNSIFPSKNYPDHFQNVTSLLEIDEVLGTIKDLVKLAEALHSRNMSLVLDLPLYPLLKELRQTGWHTAEVQSNQTNNEFPSLKSAAQLKQPDDEHIVIQAMKLWTSKGVDGFYVKGLENFVDDPYLIENVAEWKETIGPDRVLMINHKVLDGLAAAAASNKAKFLIGYVDLVDVYLNVSLGASHIAAQIKATIEGPLRPDVDVPYVHWSLGGVSERRIASSMPTNASLAGTLMELMLPGTPSIFYGDEVALQETHDPFDEHVDTKHLHHLSTMAWSTSTQFTTRDALPWIPRGAAVSFGHLNYVTDVIALRTRSPSVYQNAVSKGGKMEPNTSVKYSRNDILILERWYPRRPSFVSISNFGTKTVKLDLSSMFYGGEVKAGNYKSDRVLFSDFEIGAMQTIVVRLDK